MDFRDGDMGPKKKVTWDMAISLFNRGLGSFKGNCKRQRHAILLFFKVTSGPT